MKRGVVMIIAITSLACSARKPPGIAVPPEQQPGPERVEEASPSESMMAMQSAEVAEARGDTATALDLYDWAFLAEGDSEQQARILYRIACLRAEPGSEVHDLEAARMELDLLITRYPRHPRQREARLMLGLVDEVIKARADAASAALSLAASRSERDALRGQLKKAEEELAKIKQVLIQGKP